MRDSDPLQVPSFYFMENPPDSVRLGGMQALGYAGDLSRFEHGPAGPGTCHIQHCLADFVGRDDGARKSRRIVGSAQPSAEQNRRKTQVLNRIPFRGWMMLGRNR
jgi:hypothetical protein